MLHLFLQKGMARETIEMFGYRILQVWVGDGIVVNCACVAQSPWGKCWSTLALTPSRARRSPWRDRLLDGNFHPLLSASTPSLLHSPRLLWENIVGTLWGGIEGACELRLVRRTTRRLRRWRQRRGAQLWWLGRARNLESQTQQSSTGIPLT